jgi:hypothetical protein
MAGLVPAIMFAGIVQASTGLPREGRRLPCVNQGFVTDTGMRQQLTKLRYNHG